MKTLRKKDNMQTPAIDRSFSKVVVFQDACNYKEYTEREIGPNSPQVKESLVSSYQFWMKRLPKID